MCFNYFCVWVYLRFGLRDWSPLNYILNNFELQVVGEFTGLAPPHRGIDQSQLHQSRFGLVFQACMLMITVCFLFSDVLGELWKNR